jgi:hypothetical protein
MLVTINGENAIEASVSKVFSIFLSLDLKYHVAVSYSINATPTMMVGMKTSPIGRTVSGSYKFHQSILYFCLLLVYIINERVISLGKKVGMNAVS